MKQVATYTNVALCLNIHMFNEVWQAKAGLVQQNSDNNETCCRPAPVVLLVVSRYALPGCGDQ